VLFLAIPCPLRNLKGALRKFRPRHSPENNLRKPLRFCRGSDPNAERLERFIWRGFYYRVSTGKQDIEMPAQRAAVEAFLNGGGWKIIGEEVEVETGTSGPKEGSQRVCLQDAADHRCDPGPRPHDVGADCRGTHRQKWPTARGAEAWSMMAVSNILERKLRTEAERAAIGRL